MAKARRAADLGIRIGELPAGRRGLISDVPGVRVGHATLDEGGIKTGVTVLLPSAGDLFRNKLEAAAHVLNGFGKTVGLVQVEELGNLESPIAFTNTLSVGAVSDALVEWALAGDSGEGGPISSYNPLVCECNDSYLNDIRARAVGREELFAAMADAREDFEEGGVGAGAGMSCHGLKGGIGSASRVLEVGGEAFVFGVLVLSNQGQLRDLIVDGRRLGAELEAQARASPLEEKGSIISVIATNLPLSSRQLGRLCRRVGVGLARTGSYLGQGSGEIALAFSTASVVSQANEVAFRSCRYIAEDRLDLAFRAVIECEEEAILNSMLCASPTTGHLGHRRESLGDLLAAGGFSKEAPR
jgi:D-aminopeptidase